MSNDRLIEIDAGLSGGHVGPVIAVSELPRARRFYEGQLGLSGEAVPGGWMPRTQSGDGVLPARRDSGCGQRELAGGQLPRAGPTRHPSGSCESATCRSLEAGDLPFELDEDGISVDSAGMLVARMRDPDGSILTVFSTTSDQPVPDRSDPHCELHALVKRRIAAVRAKDTAPVCSTASRRGRLQCVAAAGPVRTPCGRRTDQELVRALVR
jgi:catechol 2,3-dioxygenase-like lactoylglutathione lyase family enzyme